MIIAVANIKGGTGKSTTSIALATAIQRDGKEVIVYDADSQGTSTSWSLEAELPFDVRPANIAILKKIRQLNHDSWIVIDTPPSGTISDEAVRAADLVIVPTSPSSADMDKMWQTVDSLKSSNKWYIVLLTKIRSNTLSLKSAISELKENNVSYFETVIPLREDIANSFCNIFGDDLYGYKEVLEEIKEVM